MEKRTQARLEAMAAYAHHLGATMGRCYGDWSREAIEKIAVTAMGIRARWHAWSADPFMVALFTLNFANGWQFANAPDDRYKSAAYQTPTITLPETEGATHA